MTYFDLQGIAELEETAQLQHGVVSAAQIEQSGLSIEQARARVSARRWQRLHRGVYATFSGKPERMAEIWAALLRCGSDAVVSHETAAELEGLCEPFHGIVHVTVGADHRVRGNLDGVRVYYAHRLPETRHPTRTPPQTKVEDTVLDLADISQSSGYAARWVTAAIQKRRTTASRLAERLASRKKIKWRAMLESMLIDVEQGAQSMLELEHLRRVERAHALPRGVRQSRVSGRRTIWIDVEYSEFATRVELDGRVGHSDERSKFRDRRRDNRGTVGQQWTLRYGHAEIFGLPCIVAAEQAYVLQQRGWDGMPQPCGPGCDLSAPHFP